MGEMHESDWSRQNVLRSDWLGPSVASMTTGGGLFNLTNMVVSFLHKELE